MSFKIDINYVKDVVQRCLQEDVGTGDLTAGFAPNITIYAQLISRQEAIICGTIFFDQVFTRLDQEISIHWRVRDGDSVQANDTLCEIEGRSQPILTGERSALNLLQTLSATATVTNRYVEAVQGTGVKILDTRKTIPGLRLAQKWAVRCGGGCNHRQGLFDGVLIKENHLRSGDSIKGILSHTREDVPPDTMVCIEVENNDELQNALDAGAKRVLLDNFSIEELRKAVRLSSGSAKLEASGNITLDNVKQVAQTGVDYISIGAITKNLQAVDLSLLFNEYPNR